MRDRLKTLAMAVAIAVAPFEISGLGIGDTDSEAGNGNTNFYSLKPGASHGFYNGVEIRICHDDGPPLVADIDPKGARVLNDADCLYSVGHALTLKNESSVPAVVHATTVQKSGH
jgi:hypothetical protein